MGKHLKMYPLIMIILVSMFIGFTEMFSVMKPIYASTPSIPVVQVYPSFVNVGVGESFTVAIIGLNLSNLYGFDIEFTWDPEILEYVRHNVTCPVENYPAPNPPSPYGGVLHNPIIEVKNIVNASGNIQDARYPETRAWISYASMYPAQPQDGNVTFFTITFKVLKTGESPLRILACDLSDVQGFPMNPIVEDGVYRSSGIPMADFSYWPDVSVVGKPTIFTAIISENVTNIKIYMWDFGDGAKQNTTQPTWNHTYTASGLKTVGLRVMDENNVLSTWKYKEIFVATSRDLGITNISFPTNRIKADPSILFTFKVAIKNYGEANETCTVYTYYNTSVVDPANPHLANWHMIGSQSIALKYEEPKILDFSLNTTMLAANASYYIFANLTSNIPEGYEDNVNNNFLFSSETVYVTNVDIHEIVIVKLECVWQSGAVKESPPLIEGEVVTVLLTIKNNGTSSDTVHIEVFLNNTSVENKTISIAWAETKEESLFKQAVPAGRYSVSVSVQAGDFQTSKSVSLLVVKPPKIEFTYTPVPVAKNQNITFNAGGTVHQDPAGTVTAYKWEFFAPGLDWTTANPTAKREGVIIQYYFTSVGNWTVVLKIEDNFGLSYNPKRPATSAYIKQLLINVVETGTEGGKGPEGVPIEYLLAIVIVIILIFAASAIYLRKRRAAKVIEEEETSE